MSITLQLAYAPGGDAGVDRCKLFFGDHLARSVRGISCAPPLSA